MDRQVAQESPAPWQVFAHHFRKLFCSARGTSVLEEDASASHKQETLQTVLRPPPFTTKGMEKLVASQHLKDGSVSTLNFSYMFAKLFAFPG